MNLNLPSDGKYVVIPLDYFEHLLHSFRTRERSTPLPMPEPTGIAPVITPPDNGGLPKGFAPTSRDRIERLKHGADNGDNSV